MNKIITHIFTICLLCNTLASSASTSSSQTSDSSSSYSAYVNKWTIGGTLAAVGVTVGALWWWKSSSTNKSGKTNRRPSKQLDDTSATHFSSSASSSTTPPAPVANQNPPTTSGSSAAMIPYQQQTQLTVSHSGQSLMCNAKPVTFAKAGQQQSWAGWVFSPFTGKPTPQTFFETVKQGQHEKVISMIEAHADINWQADNGLTAAHIAAHNNDTTMMSILTKNQREPLVKDVLGRYGDRHYSIKSADFFKVDNTGNSALHFACQNGNQGIVDIIQDSFPGTYNNLPQLVKQQNQQGYAALHVAAQAGKAHLIETLIKAKGDVNQQTNNGETPLALATKHNHENVVAALQPYQKDMKPEHLLHDKNMLKIAQQGVKSSQNNPQNPSATSSPSQISHAPGPIITEPQD